MKKSTTKKLTIKASVREFAIPPIRDAVVIGHSAPIGCAAIRKALELLVTAPFEQIPMDDDVIGDVLVRKAHLKRIPIDLLKAFILANIKPIMEADEIMQIELSADLQIEGESM